MSSITKHGIVIVGRDESPFVTGFYFSGASSMQDSYIEALKWASDQCLLEIKNMENEAERISRERRP